MKFKAKLTGFFVGLDPVCTVSTTGVKRDYPDEGVIMLTADTKGINAQANNGWVAITNRIAEQQNLEYECEDAGTVAVQSQAFLGALGNFSPSDEIIFEKRNHELFMFNKDDAEIFESLPLAQKPVDMPADAPSYGNVVKMDRELLIKGMNKVIFAIGWEKYRAEFLYWIMRIDNDYVRFACGDGGRFSIYEYTGAGKIDSTGKTDICLFREQTKDVFPKILPMMIGDKVSFSIYNSENNSDTVADQVAVECGPTRMVMVGHDPGVKWPNEDIFLTRPNTYKITMALADWEIPVRGMLATYSEDIKATHGSHVATLDFDFDKKLMYVKTDGQMKSQNKIKIRDCVLGSDVDKKLSFTVTSQFLGEVYKYGSKEGRVQMELAASNKVALVKYFAGDAVCDQPLVNVNPTTKEEEKYTIFFGPKSKK